MDLVVHAKIGKFILIQLSFLLLLNFILDTIDFLHHNIFEAGDRVANNSCLFFEWICYPTKYFGEILRISATLKMVTRLGCLRLQT